MIILEDVNSLSALLMQKTEKIYSWMIYSYKQVPGIVKSGKLFV